LSYFFPGLASYLSFAYGEDFSGVVDELCEGEQLFEEESEVEGFCFRARQESGEEHHDDV